MAWRLSRPENGQPKPHRYNNDTLPPYITAVLLLVPLLGIGMHEALDIINVLPSYSVHDRRGQRPTVVLRLARPSA